MFTTGRFHKFPYVLAALLVGCTTSSTGLDLSLRGVLHMVLSRQSGSDTLNASATVEDNGTFARNIDLANDQILSVNGTQLTPATVVNIFGYRTADLDAVDAPSQYEVAFDNQGTALSMNVTPPEDFTATGPAEGDTVSASGFDVTWSPSGAADTKVQINLSGIGPDGNDQDTAPDLAFQTFGDLADDGSATISTNDLSPFIAGTMTLTIRRYSDFEQSIGFANGEVRTEIVKTVTLTLQ
jgi:hypothetical protein